MLLRIQNLLNNIGGNTSPLDSLSRDILLYVANRQASGERLQMSDIRFNDAFGSQATDLKRLQKLIREGWLSASRDPSDGRAQILGITPKAARHIALISDQIVQVVKERDASNRR